MNDSYDSPWKDALLDLFQPFLALLFPAVEAAIDWSCEVVALDKDLRQLAPEAELGPREADMLFQAKLLDGQPGWFYLHVEVQSQHVKDFARRMFVYHYRIFDKFGDRVFSLGVLGDTSRSWRPDRFRSEWFGCRLDFHFPIVKLADFRPRLTELEGDPNPFAPFVAAHLWTQATRKRPKKRVEVKARLFRDLLRRGWDRPRVLKMLRLIDGLLKLEPPYSLQFLEKLAQYETEDQMPYISPIEQIGFDKGLEERASKALESPVRPSWPFSRAGSRLFRRRSKRCSRVSATLAVCANWRSGPPTPPR